MTFAELELQLWRTEFQLAQTNNILSQMVMKDLMPRIKQREADLLEVKENPNGE